MEATQETLQAPQEAATSQTAASREVQPIIEAYRESVETVGGYMARAVDVLEGLYADQDEMIDQLKTVLSRSKSLRRSDFDRIFTNVLADRRRTKEALPALVAGYRADREELMTEVQEMFSSNLVRAVEAWPALKQRLLDEPDAGAGQVVAALRQVHMEQEELSTALSVLLARGEKLKIRDLKTVARKLTERDSKESAELAAVLTMCESAARTAGLKWQRLGG